MDGIKTIMTRKSVRTYDEGKHIEKDIIEILAKAAMAAPSAVKEEPWEIIVIDDRKILDYLGEVLPYAKMAARAPLAFVIAGNTQKVHPQTKEEFWIQDCSAATENLLLAAHALGLGAVWTAAYPYADRMDPIVSQLGLPSHVIPLNFIPVGYPATIDERENTAFTEDKLHWNKW